MHHVRMCPLHPTQLESITENCIPLYINDNVTRYLDEVLAYDTFEVTLPEDRIPDIPAALEAAAPSQEVMRDRLFCVCKARSYPSGPQSPRSEVIALFQCP